MRDFATLQLIELVSALICVHQNKMGECQTCLAQIKKGLDKREVKAPN